MSVAGRVDSVQIERRGRRFPAGHLRGAMVRSVGDRRDSTRVRILCCVVIGAAERGSVSFDVGHKRVQDDGKKDDAVHQTEHYHQKDRLKERLNQVRVHTR